MYFYNYSTFTGKAGLYPEDLFVLPECRGRGYGLELINELSDICKKEKLGRFEWQCLNWNMPSIDFYEKLGAKQHNQRQIFRMEKISFNLSGIYLPNTQHCGKKIVRVYYSIYGCLWEILWLIRLKVVVTRQNMEEIKGTIVF